MSGTLLVLIQSVMILSGGASAEAPTGLASGWRADCAAALRAGPAGRAEAALSLRPLRGLLAPPQDRIEETPRVPGPAPLRRAGATAGQAGAEAG
ncbi:MAG: hypothetical protein SNJ73_08670 [Acetobacteraceae bacterium]